MRTFLVRSLYFFMSLVFALQGAVLNVSQDGRGEFSSVQAAINQAKAGDEVIILDFATYKEQVTIDSSKNRLVLRAENPKLKTKPVIMFKDTVNVGPRNYDESQDQSKITFDQNGAARVIRAKGVTIEGIIFDGGEPAPYGYEAIWENRFPLFSGNAALTLYVTGDIKIRNCEFRNAYFGIYVKDRNEGGIYANANPADLQPQLVVPLSGFGKTGNHLIEQNRIHHNSWGVFIESAWDLGSTFRYNMFFENNISSELAEKIDRLSGSDNQWGGAMIFKDLMLTPMAIYNNTFFKNNMILCADWQVGGTNLVFNNIFAEPDSVPATGVPAQALDPMLPYRTFNCLYATQEQVLKPRSQGYTAGMQDPATNTYVQVVDTFTGYGNINVMYALPSLKPTVQTINLEIPLSSGTVIRQQEVEWAIIPGTLIEGSASNPAFPAAANNRWFEIKFKSEDPDDPDFLSPDWMDSTTRALVLDQGWSEGGILDADGSIADIGAVSYSGLSETKIMVKPKDPVFIDGTKAKISFTITPLEGEIRDPKIRYIRWVRNVQYSAGIWGVANIEAIPATDIISIDVPNTPLVVGSNNLTVDIPAMTEAYGFFDIVIEGTDRSGMKVTTNAGFLPYRAIDYVFDVVIMDSTGAKELSEVHAGEKVQLWITPEQIDGEPFPNTVEKISVTLSLNSPLLTPEGAEFAITTGIKGTSKNQVMFTKVPPGGFESVSVSGMFINPTDTSIFYAIRGSSKDIRILPGPAEKIEFHDPRSHGVATVDPGSPRPVMVAAFDKYDNRVVSPTDVGMVSLKPETGDIMVSPVTTDSTGMAMFVAMVKGGDLYDTFPVVATLLSNSYSDSAKLVVGKPKDRLWILFDDTSGYNPDVTINTCSGERVQITIVASKDGKTVEPIEGAGITLSMPGVIAGYGSPDPLDTVEITNATLAGGKYRFWIKANTRNVLNASITVFSEDGSLVTGYREGINFTACNTEVQKAAYFADNGYGRVDRLDIYFEKNLDVDEIPDSLELRWPSSEGEVRFVKKDQCMLDAADSSHLIVTLSEPFSPEITRYTGSNAELGIYYWWNPNTPDADKRTVKFRVADSVGPLITSAMLVERLSPGEDTLYLGFTETTIADVVMGQSLEILRNGSVIPITVTTVIPQTAKTVIAVISDMGELSLRAGDSIRIASAGPIVDGSKNHAHPENRPVVVSIRTVPADIVGAAYYDMNADGTIDNVRMDFNKMVDPQQVSVLLIWEKDSAKRPLADADITIADGDTSQALLLQIPSDLFDEESFNGRTSGEMSARVIFTAFSENNERYSIVMDKAAPVLTGVAYHMSGSSSGGSVGDTLKFSLSEDVQIETKGDEPLLFRNSNGMYSLKLAWLSLKDGQYMYRIEKNSDMAGNVVLPQYNDSSWINAALGVISDLAGNVQENPQNRRVPVTLVLPEFDPEILVGPNPFDPDADENCHIIVRPKTGLAVIDNIKATVELYDKVGNRVVKLPAGESSTQVELLWDGRNTNGRLVGSGAYLAVLRCSFSINGKVSHKPPQNFIVGVKR